MPTYAVQFPSASTSGLLIPVTANATPGVAVHTSHATATDEVYIKACNVSGSAVKLTLEIGGTTAGFIIEQTIQPESGLVTVLDGARFTGSTAIAAFAGTANVINLQVDINRIT